MNIQELQNVIRERIEKLRKAEKVTKAELGAISRDLLSYVGTHGQPIELVNTLLSVLTPMNKQTAVLFFSHFLPYAFDSKAGTFKTTKLKKEKTIQAKLVDMESFLEEESNTIWTWAAENVQLKHKKFSLENDLKRVIKHIQDSQENEEAYESIDLDVSVETVMELLGAISEVSGLELNAEEAGEVAEAA